MHNRIRKALVAVTAGALLGAGLIAAPAQALASDCTAYSDVVCFHEHGDFSGRVWRQRTGQFPTGCRNLTGFNNAASTAFNRTSNYLLYLYDGGNCTGARFGVGIGKIWAAGDSRPEWNDRATSVKIVYVG